MNRRKEIRNRIRGEVQKALPGVRVFEHRQQALTKMELPAAVIWVDSEQALRVSCELIYKLKAEVRVEVLGLGGVDWLDLVSKRLENWLLRGENRLLGPVEVSKFDLVRSEIQMFKQGELDMWSCIMTFEAEYMAEPEPEESINGEIGEVLIT